MSDNQFRALETMAFKVRQHIIKMSTDGGCFVGASLSATDLIVYLYNHFLDISTETFDRKSYPARLSNTSIDSR